MRRNVNTMLESSYGQYEEVHTCDIGCFAWRGRKGNGLIIHDVLQLRASAVLFVKCKRSHGLSLGNTSMRREGSQVPESQLHDPVDRDASQRGRTAYVKNEDRDSLHPTVDY